MLKRIRLDQRSRFCGAFLKERGGSAASGDKNEMEGGEEYNLVPRARVAFGQYQDTELWKNQFPETKI